MTLKAEKLILLTNTPGVLNSDDQLLELLSETEAQDLIEQGVISGRHVAQGAVCS